MHCEPPGNQNSPSPQSFLETEGNPKSLNMPTIKPILSPREGIIRKGNTISDRITCIYGSNSISPVDPVFSPFTPQMQSTDSTSTLHKPFSKRSTTLSLMSPSPATLSVPSTSDANNRIRDNQRRSRARRAEYLQELEAKVCNYEKKGAAVSAEIQAAARRVNEENWGLRQEVERLREESRGLGGDYERLREENGVLVEENERLRRGGESEEYYVVSPV
ncbi:MAG: hypothetical protein L6R40_003987 [Gallowayella cf. fulva]|nr:MAG: hypothetical protein L6R40_003987 [Xanthomendoza cf. fulva]